MAIKPISQEEFSENVIRSFTGLTKEYSWYKSDSLDLVGVVVKDTIDKDWGYLVFVKDEDNVYRPQHVDASLASQVNAETDLYEKMLNIERTGKVTDELYQNQNEVLDLPKIEIMSIDDHIKAYFKKHPEQLYKLSPRKFEELVASIMKDMGFEVELTQATRDGGRDIIAYIRNGLTSFLAHIECKRYAPDNKVSVDIIRSVIGVHHMRHANKSVIVTTGFYTQPAIEEAKSYEHSLDLRDFHDLKAMLARY